MFGNFSFGPVEVAQNASFSSKGTYFLTVDSNGLYKVTIEADGFITKSFDVFVNCTSSNCVVEKRVILSPHLQPGQTRLILSWEVAKPSDIDLHVMSIKKSDKSLCRTWYDNTLGCPSTTQDRDNAEGGTNGPETVTLQDSAINSLYTYLIAIEDFEFENNGLALLSSGAGISLTNEMNTVEHKMVATGVNMTNDYYLFGCVDVQENGEFTYTPAPDGTFFNGEEDSDWLAMYTAHC